MFFYGSCEFHIQKAFRYIFILNTQKENLIHLISDIFRSLTYNVLAPKTLELFGFQIF